MTGIFVIIQFLCIGLLLWPFSPIQHLGGGLFVLLGLIIGYAAVRAQPRGNFNIRPDLKENAVLVTRGIYRYIRHPMYSGVLTCTLGLVVLYASRGKIVLYVILLVNIILKLLYEERLWCRRDNAYPLYCRRTKRLIPFIF